MSQMWYDDPLVLPDNECDRNGQRCYLTTSLYEPNVAIYERMGFELKRNGDVKVDEAELRVCEPYFQANTSFIACSGKPNPKCSEGRFPGNRKTPSGLAGFTAACIYLKLRFSW